MSCYEINPCPECDGEGAVVARTEEYRGWNGVVECIEHEAACPECGGEGIYILNHDYDMEGGV